VKDIEYLARATKRGYLCPKCEQSFLEFNEEVGAVCPLCGEDFPSFSLLFRTTAQRMNWETPEQAWRRWCEAHPDYEKEGENQEKYSGRDDRDI